MSTKETLTSEELKEWQGQLADQAAAAAKRGGVADYMAGAGTEAHLIGALINIQLANLDAQAAILEKLEILVSMKGT
jgi:hypothetical protein